MTCEEFERVLPEVEDRHTSEQQVHLNSCSSCSGLVADLEAIAQQAKFLQYTDEPNSRVWNSIEIALRQEGLIREKQTPFLVPSRPRSWRVAWMIPAAALMLLTAGVVRYQRSSDQTAQQIASVPADPAKEVADTSTAGDEQLLAAVSSRTPAMRAAYEANLKDVDSYIRDAEKSLKADPNDEQAQQYLRNAYEQKSMVYEMAMNRSQP